MKTLLSQLAVRNLWHNKMDNEPLLLVDDSARFAAEQDG